MGIFIPVSVAELYDKISILEIKREKIKDSDKLLNICKELELLFEISLDYPISNEFYFGLRDINLIIWELEEKIREGSDIGCFARDIHINNDKRSSIKREINLKYKSDIVEEKSYNL